MKSLKLIICSAVLLLLAASGVRASEADLPIPNLHAPPATLAGNKLAALILNPDRLARGDLVAVPQIASSGLQYLFAARDPNAICALPDIPCFRFQPPGKPRPQIFQTQRPIQVIYFQAQNPQPLPAGAIRRTVVSRPKKQAQ